MVSRSSNGVRPATGRVGFRPTQEVVKGKPKAETVWYDQECKTCDNSGKTYLGEEPEPPKRGK